ncbi:carbohydrate-binding family 9-like protein [Paenibacillus radicis (ex Gao et al. 2016)]|uniref:Carbohydrate-binding domain-containing protein n=1 Tax=Paenibacillus radicis (ex Gao et al. 2016) TaxID=1737354 RepID=A0A917LWG8_9BACL|nr:carbohydrate-binding family 9-like protein [Paenibacillus radicis (ex Gao et al. 2016)]GGG61712.1 hypothetical protein GCM10010918_14090 [Paenibacillus radicis (ex Gao et al. 2016)]
MRYVCRKVEGPIESVKWDGLEAVSLVQVVSGEAARLQTSVKVCWSEDALMVRFDCEDDHRVATMTERDAPLYQEDVVEIFLDAAGKGRQYREFVISPRNIVYDASIGNDGEGNIDINVGWNAEGLQTSVIEGESGAWACELYIPFINFDAVPVVGTEWRSNMYRIDDDKQGNRHFWSWSPIGSVHFHLPKHFGTLVFAE